MLRSRESESAWGHEPRSYLLRCDRCGWEAPGPISEAAAYELDGTDCFACEVDPIALEWAQAMARAWADPDQN